MDRLAAMASFARVVERGSFAAAGRSLGVPASVVAYHVRLLETRLGGLLLNRTTRRQSLTELGRAYHERCRRVLAELDAAEAEAAELRGEPRGSLRVTAPHSIGSTALPPLIAAYLRLHPGVEVDLSLSNSRLDLLADGFDVAIRGGALEDSRLVARALAPLALAVRAAPSYLAARGEPGSLAGLRHHDFLDFTASAAPGAWRFEAGGGATVDVPAGGRFRANSGHALRAAALAGLGVISSRRSCCGRTSPSGA